MRRAAVAIKVYSVGAQETSHAQVGMRSSKYAWCYRRRSALRDFPFAGTDWVDWGESTGLGTACRQSPQHEVFRSWVQLIASKDI